MRIINIVALVILLLCPGAFAGQNVDLGKAPTTYTSGISLVNSSVLRKGTTIIYNLTIHSSTTQFILLYDSTSVPADGSGSTPVDIFKVTANVPLNISYAKGKTFPTGVVFSNSSTAPSKTIGSADTFASITADP